MMGKQLVATKVRASLGVCAWMGLLGTLSVGVNGASADDDDIVNANGFEAPFSTSYLGTGQLEGQVNPAGEGQSNPPGQWLRTQVNGPSTAFVQNSVFAPGGGTQAVKVDRAANDDTRWAVPVNHLGYPDYPNPFPPEPQQPCICITWDMRVEQSAGNGDTTFGPFFGVEAYDDDSVAAALLGSLGVDAATGDVLYQEAVTGFLTDTGLDVGFGAWNRFNIKLDYSTKEYSIFLNNVMLLTETFVDNTKVAGGLIRFTDANISALAAAGNPASLAMTGTAYFDNFLVREGECIIPEPGTLILMAFGLAGAPLIARRRSR